MHPPIYLISCLPLRLSIRLFICLYIHIQLYISVYLSSIHLSVIFLPVCHLSIYLSKSKGKYCSYKHTHACTLFLSLSLSHAKNPNQTRAGGGAAGGSASACAVRRASRRASERGADGGQRRGRRRLVRYQAVTRLPGR